MAFGSSYRCWLRTLLVSGPLLVAVSLPAQAPAVRQAFERGANAMHNGQLSDAEAAFREAVRLAPELPEAHLDLGLVLGREGKNPEAITEIRRALELDPELASAHMFLGIFLLQSNQPDAAREALESEIRTSPTNAEAMVWLATVELNTGRPSRAAAALDRAAELAPNDLNILELRGKAHSQVAQESYNRMAKLDPGSWHVHRVRAELDVSEGKREDAIKELQAAVQQEKRSSELFELLGDQYRATSQMEAAESAYRREQELAPTNAIALYNLGSTLVDRGDAQHGVPLLQQTAVLYPGAPVVQYFLGRGLALLGQNEQAAVALRRATTESRNEIAERSYFELARVERRLHHEGEAHAAVEQYNRLRAAREQAGAQEQQDWKELNAASRTAPQ